MKTKRAENLHELGETLERMGEILEDVINAMSKMEEFESLADKFDTFDPPDEKDIEMMMEKKGHDFVLETLAAFEKMDDGASGFEDLTSLSKEEQQEFVEVLKKAGKLFKDV